MSSRLRIAFIFNFITPYRTTFFEKLCSHQEYEWLVFHGVKEKEDGRPAYKGVLCFPNTSLKYNETRIGSFEVRWQEGLVTRIQEWKPDVVITLGIPGMLTNWLAMIWAHRHGAKTIIWHTGWEAQAGNPYSLPIKRWITSRFLSLADHTLAYSTKGAAYLLELQGGQPDERITVCYNGLDIDPLLEREAEFRDKGRALRRQQQIGERKIFLYVGGMLEEKKVALLLTAFHDLRASENAVLWLVGDGPDLQKLKQVAESLNARNVVFWGRVIDDVDVFFASADYFVLPGVGGLALNQALFWGLPCIVSEADGTEDDLVFENKTGFRFTANDGASLTAAMQRCLALPDEQTRSFGAAGRSLVLERSNVNEMVNTFVTTIQQLTGTNAEN